MSRQLVLKTLSCALYMETFGSDICSYVLKFSRPTLSQCWHFDETLSFFAAETQNLAQFWVEFQWA